uniref:Vomeronasal type-1 receptor n=1 Tax=Erpetoichthys calabaricus TaxID=27687 RepID=A0A8C4SVP9_ERPCA
MKHRVITMDRGPAVKAAGFLVLTVISIPANLAVCSAFLCSFLAEGKLMTADIILCHLALVNLLVAFVRSIPQTLAAFGYQNLFDDLGCKLSLLCFRILRGLSISLTCLLSTYQAVLIAPASSKLLLALLKLKLPQYLLLLLFLLYLFCGVTSVNPIIFTVAYLINNTIPPYTFNLEFCFTPYPDYPTFIGQGFTNFLRDFIFIVLMAVMSAYILILLYRHSQKVKHIRSSDRGHSGARAETRASQVVVTLVILYVIFFGVDNAIWLYSLSTVRVAVLLSDIRIFFATLYTSVFGMRSVDDLAIKNIPLL